MLFISRREPSEVLDPVEEPFDAVARAVEHRAEAGLPAAVNHCRGVWCRTDGFDAPTQPVRIVSLVSEGDGVRLQPAEQLFSKRTITPPGRGPRQPEPQTPGIG